MTDHPQSPAALLGAAIEDERLRKLAAEPAEPEERADDFDPAYCRALPWIERQGWLIYWREAGLFATFELHGEEGRLRTDPRYFALIIEAMRLGDHTTLAALSEATGVPRGTISSHQHRYPDLKTALDLLRDGPILFWNEAAEGRGTAAGAIHGTNRWPHPRWMYEPSTLSPEEEAKLAVETAEDYIRAGLDPPPPDTGWPREPDVEGLYAVADRHWCCPWPYGGPHLPGEEPRAHIFTLDRPLG